MYLLPMPKKVVETGGEFLAESGLKIIAESEELKITSGWALPYVLKDDLKKFAGVEAEITAGRGEDGDISLRIVNGIITEAYELIVTENKIEILGGDRAGVGHGIRTLCQLIRNYGGLLPTVKIEDVPDIATRGFYMDQARGRSFKLNTIKKQIDLLSRHKLNQYQLYIEQSFAFRGFSEMWREDSVLTPEEIMELDKYCLDRDIDFVPSLASFGHLYELLRTKCYEDICELENAAGKPFSFWEKMQHHTVNVDDERSFEVIKKMLDEYLPLFSSKLVNICADETFDLGKGRSKALAEKIGIDRIYMDFLKKLCEYVVSKGKIPMFWGDIVRKFPEFIKELPKETICMAWGYMAEQKDDICEPIAKAGANLYLCPGACGWNTLINRIDTSYSNVKIMSGYAREYKAIGLLNTEWGDFGHINNPTFSTPGIVYGGVFTWNLDAYSGENAIGKDEINEAISFLEYGDRSVSFVELLEKASLNQIYDWWTTVLLFEGFANDGFDEKTNPAGFNSHKVLIDRLERFKKDISDVDKASKELYEIRKSLRKTALSVDKTEREEIYLADNAILGIDIWNRVGRAVVLPETADEKAKYLLAEELETWYMRYKEIFRSDSKESMLGRVTKVVLWYADKLRGL